MKFFNINYLSFVTTTIIMNCIEYILRHDDIKLFGDEEYSETLSRKYLMYDAINTINYNLLYMHVFYMYIYLMNYLIDMDVLVDIHILYFITYVSFSMGYIEFNLLTMNTWLCLIGCNTIKDYIFTIYIKIN